MFNFRFFVDFVFILEWLIVEKVGFGWIGKYLLILSCDVGLFFFFGELLIDLFLLVDSLVVEECGCCVVCMIICFIGVIVEFYIVDVWCCIFYFIIELEGVIFEEFCLLIGNCIYGCDDC